MHHNHFFTQTEGETSKSADSAYMSADLSTLDDREISVETEDTMDGETDNGETEDTAAGITDNSIRD